MRLLLTTILFFRASLFAIQTDFDVAVVGSSPISLLEAIYHIYQNEKVLILEADEQLGGAWKSIDICGVSHADLGCHLIGSDPRLKSFFQQHFGCKFICLQHPYEEASGNHAYCIYGYYFSKGCYELISKLVTAIGNQSNAVLLNQKLESIYIDQERSFVELSTTDSKFTTAKLIITPVSSFNVDNPGYPNQQSARHPYHHVYLLIEDPTPACFTYLNGVATGMSRAMNLTPFLDMPRENLQLIVVQTYGNIDEIQIDTFLKAFQSRGLLTENAQIIQSDFFEYYQSYMNTSYLTQIGGMLIETLDTSSFAGMIRYVDKWESVLPAVVP